jgi:hypothetical protein
MRASDDAGKIERRLAALCISQVTTMLITMRRHGYFEAANLNRP